MEKPKYGKKIIGYTAGVYDLFHIGHLNILRRAKEKCDYLIVGITTDELVKYKGTPPAVPLSERMDIVKSIQYVDEVVIQDNLDKIKAWEKYHYDILFVGDDWKGTQQWNDYEVALNKVGAKIIYLPYTKTTSSALITKKCLEVIKNANK